MTKMWRMDEKGLDPSSSWFLGRNNNNLAMFSPGIQMQKNLKTLRTS
jgi:hypothetical protein